MVVLGRQLNGHCGAARPVLVLRLVRLALLLLAPAQGRDAGQVAREAPQARAQARL